MPHLTVLFVLENVTQCVITYISVEFGERVESVESMHIDDSRIYTKLISEM